MAVIDHAHSDTIFVHSHITFTTMKGVAVGHCKVISVSSNAFCFFIIKTTTNITN